jgi:hypothetical protein
MKLAKVLGWFSIVSGALELLESRAGKRGRIRRRPRTVTGSGLRDIVTGAGILAANRPAPWVWLRAAGDAFDLAALGAVARRSGKPARGGILLAMAVAGGVAIVDVLCARRLAPPRKTTRDYSDRSGFPRPPDEMRGAALAWRAARSQPVEQSWVREGIERFSALRWRKPAGESNPSG